MKRVFALLLLLAFSAQTFSQAIVILHFYFHRSIISATQCENRYRPMMHCNGKCQLAKRLKQQEKKEQQNPERKLENKSEEFAANSYLAFAFEMPCAATPAYHATCASKPVDRPSLIFHPPGE